MTRRLLQVRDDRGSMLIELMVVTVLISMIMGVTVATMVAGGRTSAANAKRLSDQGLARVAMDAMTKNMRAAVKPDNCTGTTSMFVTASPRDVSFYANVNTYVAPNTYTGPRLMRYWVAPNAATGENVLYETMTPAVANPTPNVDGCPPYLWPAGGAVTRQLARGLTFATAATPLFVYYKAADTAAAGTVPDSHTSTVATPSEIDTVEMRLTIDAKAGVDVAGTTLVDRVTLVNADVR